MRSLSRRCLAGLLGAWLLLSSCAVHLAPRSESARLDALFADLHRRGLFDGAVVVGRGEEVVWSKGFGLANVEARERFTPETAADGASLAKTFTAALVLMLQRDGLLRLDDSARRFLPELPYPEITLRDLLSHTSGLPDYGWFDPFIGAPIVRTTEALLFIVKERKPQLSFAPGTAFEYSSFGFDLAALAASRAAGEPFGTLLQKRIFGPLGIRSAFLRPGRFGDFPGVRTRGYRREGDRLIDHEVFDYEAFHGGSNIYISAADLHRWNAAYLGPSPLDRRALEDSLAFTTVGGSRSALTIGSWYYSADRSSYWYSGHLEGFHDEVFRNLPRGVSIVYMSNNTIEPWLQKGIVRAVNAILTGAEVSSLQPPATIEIREGRRQELAGRWRSPDGSELTIDLADGSLHLTLGGVRYLMVQIDPKAFYVPGTDLMIGLGGDDRLHISSNTAELWGTRN